jgi:hemolysin activation/secretion protein
MPISSAFIPPPRPPAIVRRSLGPTAGIVVRASSHGWDYVLTGNTLLSPQALQRALADVRDPQAALQAVTQAYRARGYFLVAVTAKLPQAGLAGVASHRVELNVYEGQVTHQKVPPKLAGYFRGIGQRADLTTSAVVRRVLQADSYASRVGLSLRTGFAPAPEPGGSAFEVSAEPQPGFSRASGAWFLGNYGSRYVSSYVTGFNATLHPGGGTEFTANYTAGLPYWTSSSRDSQYHAQSVGGSIATPLGIYGLNFQKSHYQLGRIVYPLNTTGDTTITGLTGSQTVYADLLDKVTLSEGFNHVENRSTVYGGSYTLTDQRYDFATLGLKYTRSYALGSLPGSASVTASYARGTSARSGTFLLSAAPTAPTPLFHYRTVGFELAQQLPDGYMAQVVYNSQWALDTLPQQQQWVVGGFGNISAYNSGVAVGDSGYSLRAVLQTPGYALGSWRLTPNAFVEAASTSYRFVQASSAHLVDAGIGINVAAPHGFTASAVYAAPLHSSGLGPAVAQSSRGTIFFVVQKAL